MGGQTAYWHRNGGSLELQAERRVKEKQKLRALLFVLFFFHIHAMQELPFCSMDQVFTATGTLSEKVGKKMVDDARIELISFHFFSQIQTHLLGCRQQQRYSVWIRPIQNRNDTVPFIPACKMPKGSVSSKKNKNKNKIEPCPSGFRVNKGTRCHSFSSQLCLINKTFFVL